MIGLRQLDAASTAQVRLANFRADLDSLLQTQLGEETALRGYVATRDPTFLDTDRAPDGAFDRLAVSLRDRLRVEGLDTIAGAVDDILTLHGQWEHEVALPLMHDPGSRDAYVQQSRGKVLTDLMSSDARAVRAALSVQSDGVEQTLRRRINATVAISAGIVTLFAILALWYAIGRATVMTKLAREQTLVDALQRTLRVSGVGLPRAQMGFAYASATSEALVGGDVIDSWRSGPDRGWFLIADASGKGIEAARHAAFVQYAIRALAAEAVDPADVVARFNRLYVSTIDDPSAFIVLFLGAFDGGNQTLRYASAGHGTAYVRRGSLVERLPPTGPIIGIDAEQQYQTETVPLAIGDIVLIATDGLSEARDGRGELLGDDRIVTLLRDGPAEPQSLCDVLIASADDFSGGAKDDMAIVALRVVKHDVAAVPFGPVAADDEPA
ncbi:hypothetical protein WPS_14960 [Vulcanimicrobium alpinum]|uniref:PPM-type phosphatase domain-containing protein n=1 Tax=Vulcanimicrobium alpinum TaxID=3016050 RepID=A0AAN1XWE5_UNVUL|nr:SpoIIE family protein phosphatase [Vulcanimicrobium alpinum]BDE06220.1 hypothetical protein WPS_14960 [Vulcanimicrobium alpinum]